MRAMTKPLALTLGEPAGIGPDIALAVWTRRKELALPPFYLAGDRRFLDGRAKQAWPDKFRPQALRPREAIEAFAECPARRRYRRCGNRRARQARRFKRGSGHRLDPPRGRRRSRGPRRAPSSPTRSPRACSIAAGFKHPGHTEYLAELAADGGGAAPRPVMMLWSPTLAVIPVTIHVALREAIAQLTTRDIVETCTIAAERAEAPLRHRQSADRRQRTEPACRRGRLARQRGQRDRRAGRRRI